MSNNKLRSCGHNILSQEFQLSFSEPKTPVFMEKETTFTLIWCILVHFMGIDYQELTKKSYFGHSDVYEACMVVKSWGSNRQCNLLQNEYHIVLRHISDLRIEQTVIYQWIFVMYHWTFNEPLQWIFNEFPL